MMTTNYHDMDDNVESNLDWNTERKISYKRSLPSPWMAPPGHWTHCLQSTCKHVGWLLLCYYTVSTINMHVHGAWWEDGCYYALPLARKCFERNTQHSGIVYDPTNLHHKSTHNKHNAKFTKYIKLYCVPISVHRVDTFKIDRIWLLRALALLHWSRSVAGPK